MLAARPPSAGMKVSGVPVPLKFKVGAVHVMSFLINLITRERGNVSDVRASFRVGTERGLGGVLWSAKGQRAGQGMLRW